MNVWQKSLRSYSSKEAVSTPRAALSGVARAARGGVLIKGGKLGIICFRSLHSYIEYMAFII